MASIPENPLSALSSEVNLATRTLLDYCAKRDWAGYDPYDALNSPIFKAIPWANTRWPRLILTQLLKRSPINVRPLLAIPQTQNPKAMALFLGSALKLAKIGLVEKGTLAASFIEKIVALRSPDFSYWNWGYSFPWQTRTIVVPRGDPNVVCTLFVANALLDAYEENGDEKLLAMASSSADYIATNLFYTEPGGVASFSYPLPTSRTKVHNANLLAAALLCRVYHHTRNERLLEPALQAARYSASKQKPDGSWLYGELPTQAWVDNFHTGYNLSGLRMIDQYLGTTEFAAQIRRGFEFYVAHFFREDGAPRYFHDRTYPIDIHCVAQSIITLLEFRDLHPDSLALVASVYRWSMRNMRGRDGNFYYRKLPGITIRTSYMRWSQAWMLYALSTLAEAASPRAGGAHTLSALSSS